MPPRFACVARAKTKRAAATSSRCAMSGCRHRARMACEGRSEIERALTGRRPKLVADLDLHGILHCHTDTSAPRRWRRRSGSKPRATTWSRRCRPRSGSAPLLGQAKDGAGRILHKSTTGNAALCTRLTSTHPSLRSGRHGAPALLEMRHSKPGLAGPIRQVSREADVIRRYPKTVPMNAAAWLGLRVARTAWRW